MTVSHFFFKYRSYTPVPLIIVMLVFASPGWLSLGAGLAVSLCGELIRFMGVAYAGKATRRTKKAGASRLVTDGPFAYVRNPLYAGNFLLSLGVVIMANAWMPWMLALYTGLFFLQYSFIVRHEEQFLRAKFPEFAEYAENVPRWIPRTTPYSMQNAVPGEPAWRKARRSERNTFQAIVIIVLLILVRWHLL
ncbi:isoprenylcysteine carboxylmethyltransferase family protein [bacterium]|nr:isoprenylcysteine carboxylmethyltransferase family protein [bacterium]